MGYVETKYVAEELLRAAGRAGLPVAIYRPLDIVGSVRTGAWNTSTEMAALIRFIADTGLAPDIDLPLDFVAADTCAAAIRHISVTAGAAGPHLPSRQPRDGPARRSWSDGCATAATRSRRYRSTTGCGSSRGRPPVTRRSPMAAFLPLFVDRGAGGLTVAEMYLKHVFPAYSRGQYRARAARQRHRLPARQRAAAGPQHRPADADRLPAGAAGRAPAGPCRLTATRTGSRSGSPAGLAGRRPAAGRARPGGLLRRPEPGQRARRVPAGHRPDARRRRVFPHPQRGPVRGPGGGRARSPSSATSATTRTGRRGGRPTRGR